MIDSWVSAANWVKQEFEKTRYAFLKRRSPTVTKRLIDLKNRAGQLIRDADKIVAQKGNE